jgi:hypothetical protein
MMAEANKEWEDPEAQQECLEVKWGRWPRQETSLKEKKKLPYASPRRR